MRGKSTFLKNSFFGQPFRAWLFVVVALVAVILSTSVKLDANLRRNDRSHVLISAARDGDTHMVKTLLNQGVDTNLKDNQGKTSLEYAEAYGHTDIAATLKDAGAINIRR